MRFSRLLIVPAAGLGSRLAAGVPKLLTTPTSTVWAAAATAASGEAPASAEPSPCGTVPPIDRRIEDIGRLHPLGVETGQAVAVGLLWYAMTLIVSLAGAPAFAIGHRGDRRRPHATAAAEGS